MSILGEDEDALNILNQMCKANGRAPIEVTLTTYNEECGDYMAVFRPPFTRYSLQLYIYLCQL